MEISPIDHVRIEELLRSAAATPAPVLRQFTTLMADAF